MKLEPAQRLIDEPVEHGWRGADVSPVEYVDDEWVKKNTKEVTDGVDEGTDRQDS